MSKNENQTKEVTKTEKEKDNNLVKLGVFEEEDFFEEFDDEGINNYKIFHI